MVKTLFFLFAVSLAGSAFAQGTLQCESSDGRRHECKFEGLGTVQLTEQLSRTSCLEGESWGVYGNTIWVDHGCRAAFRYTAGNNRSTDGWNMRNGGNDNRPAGRRMITVTCESKDGRRTRCAADTLGQVTLGHQLTRRDRCVEGRTWGYDSQGIWVDGGCRAEFQIADNGANYRERRPSQAMRTVVCESDGVKRSYCRADTRFGVQLMREMSAKHCVLNRTWGSDSDGVWVSNGCRAEFGLKTRL